MQKMLYFRVAKGGAYEGELADVNCRFCEGRVYEISERNQSLCASIKTMADEGKFELLERAQGMDLLEAQEIEDRKRKQSRLAERAAAQGVSVDALPPKAAATIVTE